MIQIADNPVARRVLRQVLLSACITIVTGIVACLVLFGTDSSSQISVGYASLCFILMGLVMSMAVAGGMSYRTAVLVQKLSLARAELFKISRTDQLTGLLNRRGFSEAAVSALQQAAEDHLPVVALMCDIDRFKDINDEFGHEFGDQVLNRIAEVFRSFADEHQALVARHGGEEFSGLIVGASSAQVTQFADQLRQACSEQTISNGDVSTSVTISIGVAAARRHTNLSRMLDCADSALYVAKRQGRNCIVTAEVPVELRAA